MHRASSARRSAGHSAGQILAGTGVSKSIDKVDEPLVDTVFAQDEVRRAERLIDFVESETVGVVQYFGQALGVGEATAVLRWCGAPTVARWPSRSRPLPGGPPQLGACTRQEPGCQINGNRCGTRCWIRRAGGWVAAVVRTARCRSRRSALDQACRTSWTGNHRRSHRRVCRFRQQQLRPTRRGRARG